MILSGMTDKKKKPEVHILFLFSDQFHRRCQRNGASVSVGLYVRTCIETVGCGNGREELHKFSEHTCSRCMYMYVCLEYIHVYMYNKYRSEIELSRLEF